jgi:hypothetical protein
MFRHVSLLLAIVKKAYLTRAAYVSTYMLEVQHIIKIDSCTFIAFKLLCFKISSNGAGFGSRCSVSWVHAMNELAICILCTSYRCMVNVQHCIISRSSKLNEAKRQN